jgi:hypothetical protein
MRVKQQRVIVGYVVKREVKTQDPVNPSVVHTVRTEVSRVFHSVDAARVCLEMCKKQWPEGDFFVHSKTKRHQHADIE